jgi:GNAT superfamily N-acetyltransferase
LPTGGWRAGFRSAGDQSLSAASAAGEATTCDPASGALALYLLAWQGPEVVGRVTLLLRSRYPEVRSLLAGMAEMNALEARPQGQGIGTALILAGQREAKRRGTPILGLAVEVANHGARRLYERLGYVLWEHGLVIDRWTEKDDKGRAVREHADQCFYLTKALSE